MRTASDFLVPGAWGRRRAQVELNPETEAQISIQETPDLGLGTATAGESAVLGLATAGVPPGYLSDEEHLKYPRIDYLELQRRVSMDVLDYGIYSGVPWGGMLHALDTRVRSDLYLTWRGLWEHRRHRHSVVFAMSERAGIPFAGLRRLFSTRERFVSMFTCWSDRQERWIRHLGLFGEMDSIIVLCQSMKRHFQELGVPASKIQVIPHSVDQRFFRPGSALEQEPDLVLSIGETRSRDYPAFFRAVDGISARFRVLASGHWYAREHSKSLEGRRPVNVRVQPPVTQARLRDLYARCLFVVLPIRGVPFAAGATGALEAACMQRAVVTFRSEGIEDFLIDGETALVVEPGDSAAMRDAIQHLLDHPEEARRLGRNGRRLVEEKLNLDRYVEELATFLNSLL